MSKRDHWIVRIADWQQDNEPLKHIRRQVFIKEQRVPEALEWDQYDETSTHFLAINPASGEPIGTARLLPDGQIGRMAVLRSWRGFGVGTSLLKMALNACTGTAYLHAQVHAIPFYVAHGFIISGKEFMEAGIPHQKMIRPAEHEGSNQTSGT